MSRRGWRGWRWRSRQRRSRTAGAMRSGMDDGRMAGRSIGATTAGYEIRVMRVGCKRARYPSIAVAPALKPDFSPLHDMFV